MIHSTLCILLDNGLDCSHCICTIVRFVCEKLLDIVWDNFNPICFLKLTPAAP